MYLFQFSLSNTDRELLTHLTAAVERAAGAITRMDADVQALTEHVAALKVAVATDANNKKAAGDEITAAIKRIGDLLAAKTGTVLTPEDVAAIQTATSDIQTATTTIVTPIDLPALPA